MFNKFKCILFDLDGTLIDTSPLILDSFKYTICHHFNENKSDEEIIRSFGKPLKTSFEEMYPGKEDILVSTYREYNEQRHDCCCGIFMDMIPVLTELKAKGTLLGVVTSKRRELALRGMKLFGIDEYMSVFIGLEDTTRHKPDGEPIQKALALLNFRDKEKVLYVGDSSYDILCAKDAGVKSAAVEWTCIPIEELMKSKPDILLKWPRDLLQYA